MLNLLLIGSAEDRVRLHGLEETLAGAGCAVAVYYPDLGADVTLTIAALRVMQQAEYFVYLVSANTKEAPWLKALTPDAAAALCADGVAVLMLVCDDGALPPALAELPSLYFLDADTAPALWVPLAEALARLHEMQPVERAILRYSALDVETFLKMAQSLAVAYTGLESAWEDIQRKPPVEALAAFRRLTAPVDPRLQAEAYQQLERRAADLHGADGVVTRILSGCQQLVEDWRDISAPARFATGEISRALVSAARLRAAAFTNFLYLTLALKLLPYCDRHAAEQEPTLDRLSFLRSGARRKS